MESFAWVRVAHCWLAWEYYSFLALHPHVGFVITCFCIARLAPPGLWYLTPKVEHSIVAALTGCLNSVLVFGSSMLVTSPLRI